MRRSLALVLSSSLLVWSTGYAHSLLGKSEAHALDFIHIPAQRGVPPTGLSVTDRGDVFVTAEGLHDSYNPNPGKIYFAHSGEKTASLAPVDAPEGISYGRFFGHDMDSTGNIMYVCSNSNLKTVAPAVVILRKEEGGRFSWIHAANFSLPGEFCMNAVRYDKSYILASNSHPRGDLNSVAVYCMSLTKHDTFMRPAITYRDLKYSEKEIQDPSAGVTGLAAMRKNRFAVNVAVSGSPGPWFAVFHSPYALGASSGALGQPTIIKKSKENSFKKITALRFLSPDVIILAAIDSMDTPNLWSAALNKEKMMKITDIHSPSDALALGRDPFGKTENRVAFVLNQNYSAGGYSVDEYEVE